ncbi:MAG: TatD family hydrolase [Planctomycetota bacterium]|jgi:TatD DNase family protein
MIDTHCHLTFPDFEGRIDDVLAAARAAGVRACITVATTTDNCAEVIRLADAHPDVWCTAGVHPLYSDAPISWSALEAAGRHPRCVAWGELGLDNHYTTPLRSRQDEVLEEQLRFLEARADDGLVKPVIVHCREAFDDLLAVFRTARLAPERYVFHCFTGGPDDARRVLDFGAWISFTGVVTFRNATEVADAARIVPADRIMVETDAPFLSPEPVRSMRPNEPANVVHTARFIAALRGVDPGDFEATLDANAQRFFGIEVPASVVD